MPLDEDHRVLEKCLNASVVQSTRNKYSALWKRWTTYSERHSMMTLPAKPNDVALFLAHLANTGAKTVCIAAASSISWFHASHGFPTPCNSLMIKTGARKMLASPVAWKEPITKCLLVIMMIMMNKEIGNSADHFQFKFYSTVAFFGLFRYSDMCRLKIKDFHFTDKDLMIHIASSKTDVMRAGAEVFIAANEQQANCCPVAISRRYINKLRTLGFTPVMVVPTRGVRRFSLRQEKL